MSSSKVIVCDFNTIISNLVNEFEINIRKYKCEKEYALGRYRPEKELCELIDQNVKGMVFTRMCISRTICEKCWATSIIKVAKFEEIRKVFQHLPDHIKETLAFPQEKFEMVGCPQGCHIALQKQMGGM